MHKVSDVMTRDVDVLELNADLVEVAQAMRSHHLGILPVSDGKKVQGVVTKSDVVIRAIAKNKDPRSTSAADVMSRHVDYCFEDQRIEDAAEIMHSKDVNHLLVLDRQNNLVGVVSLGHLAAWVGKRFLSGRPPIDTVVPSIRIAPWRGFRTNRVAFFGAASAALVALAVGVFGRQARVSESPENSQLGDRNAKAA